MSDETADTYWVHIEVGDRTWDLIEKPEGGVAADDGTVLDGLWFGWAQPGPVRPLQPEPETASFSLTVPNFADFADVVRGDPVAIEVSLYTNLREDGTPGAPGVVVARFYGTVDTPTATPRGRRKGVTLSIIAVDHTAFDFTASTVFSFGTPVGSYDALDTLNLINFGMGGDVDDDWPFPADELLHNRPSGQFVARQYIDDILTEAVWNDDFGDPTAFRLILAPRIVDRRIATTGRIYVLDRAYGGSTVRLAPILTLAAGVVERDITWAQPRVIDTVSVTGATDATGPGDPVPVTGTAHSATLPTAVHNVNVDLAEHGSDRSQKVADFYLGTPDDDDRWQIAQVVIRPHLLTPEQRLSFPPGLFPDWTLEPGDPDRSSCYFTTVRVTDLDDTYAPYAANVDGILDSARCTLSGGRVVFTLGLRSTRHT